jgi:hypothetical protein
METEAKNRQKKRGGRAYRSCAEPFVDFIRQQRQERRTWQEIAEQLRSEKGCSITFQGLHQFYRRFVKRQARGHWESETASLSFRQSNPHKVNDPRPASAGTVEPQIAEVEFIDEPATNQQL